MCIILLVAYWFLSHLLKVNIVVKIIILEIRSFDPIQDKDGGHIKHREKKQNSPQNSSRHIEPFYIVIYPANLTDY